MKTDDSEEEPKEKKRKKHKKSKDTPKEKNLKDTPKEKKPKETSKEKDSKTPKTYKCDNCEETFPTVYKLHLHKAVHKETKPYKCQKCSKKFTHQVYLNRHLLCHQDKKLPCHLCEKSFASDVQLKAHVKRHAKTELLKCSRCCRKPYKRTRSAFEDKDNDFVCDKCEKLKCKICLKYHRNEADLKTHVDLHNGIISYKCKKCTAKFSRKDELNYHMQKIHRTTLDSMMNFKVESMGKEGTSDGEKVFKCTKCAISFPTEDSLMKHLTKTKKHLDDLVLSKTPHNSIHDQGDSVILVEDTTPSDGNDQNIEVRVNKTFVEIIRNPSTSDALEDEAPKQPQAKTIILHKIPTNPEKNHTVQSPESIHIPKEQLLMNMKPPECHNCGKSFGSRVDLGYHEKTCGLLLYSCKTCSQKFPTKIKLEEHKNDLEHFTYDEIIKSRISGAGVDNLKVLTFPNIESEYRCAVCDGKFPTMLGLREHMKKHETVQHECHTYCKKILP